MGVIKKTCYTIECDADDCKSLCNKLEDYVGPLDSLTVNASIAEDFAREHGFIQISARRWLCPSCADKLGIRR